MISGKFGDEDALLFEIEIITADGLELAVDGMFDTGLVKRFMTSLNVDSL